MKKILAICENKKDLTSIEVVLNNKFPDCRVLTSQTGEEGIIIAIEQQPDTILLDISIPGMDGYDISEKLKNNEFTKHIPVIILKANKTNKESSVKSHKSSADAFLSKPIDPVELSALINVMLRIKEAEDKLQSTGKPFDEKVKKSTNELEHIIQNLSTQFVGCVAEKFDSVIDSGLAQLGKFLEVDRAYVFQHYHEQMVVSNTNEWCAEGIEPQIMHLQCIPFSTIPAWMEQLEAFEDIHIPSVADLPESWKAEQEILEAQDIQSLVVVPISVTNILLGFIGFDAVRFKRIWKQEEIALLRLVGNLIGNALYRKQVEEKVQESQLRFKEMAELIPQPIWETDLKGNFIYTNHAGFEMFNYTREDMYEGIGISDLIVPEDRKRIYGNLKKILSGESFEDHEYTGLKKDGTRIPILIFSSPIISKGKLTGIRGITLDITKRKHAEDVLLESNEKFRNLAENSPNMIFINQGGKVIYANKVCEDITGYTIDEFYSHDFDFRILIQSDYLEQIQSNFETHLKGKDVPPCEFSIRTKSGKRVVTILNTKLITVKGENAILGIMTDITGYKLAEKALKESENRFKAFSEATYEAIFITENGFIVDASEAANNMTGYSYNELKGMFATDLIADESKEFVKNNMLSNYEKPYDAIAQRKNGTKLHVEIHGRMYDFKGKKVRIASVKDITKQKENAILLQKRLDFIRFTSKLSTDFINIKSSRIDETITELLKLTTQFNNVERAYVFLLSPDKKRLELTHEWCDDNVIAHKGILDGINVDDFVDFVVTLKRNEIVQLNIVDLEPVPENKSMLDILNLLEIKSFINLPMIVGNKFIGYIGFDSTVKQTEWTPEMIDSFNLCKAIIANTIERKVVEETLKESEEKYRNLFENIGEGVLTVDLEENIIHCNPAAEKIFGVPPNKLIKRNLNEFTTPETFKIIHTRTTARKQGKNSTYEFSIIRPDGKERHLLNTVSPKFDKDGNVIGCFGIFHDITDRKKAEQALQQHTQQLQERNEDLDAFAHTVAHDLKNPLGNIMGFSSLLNENYTKLPQVEIKEYIGALLNGGKKMKQIIDSLLLLANLRKTETKSEELNMSDIVAETISRLTLLIKKTNTEIIIPDVWPVALGYAPWVEEVWINFLSNAIKYGGTPPSIEIGTKVEDKNKSSEGMIRFWIRDNGPGISSENQKLLYNKFERLEQVKTEGHGLGLSIVRRIIEKLGGQVGMENNNDKNWEGQGSTFYFTLPYTGKTMVNVLNKGKTADIKKDNELSDLKVLIAEDVESADLHLSIIMKNISKEILHTKTGNDTVKICQNNPDLDLILMDIQMPEMNGYEATRKIREFNKDVVIIAQTAYALRGDRENALESGCDDYISKPINKDMLLEMIERLLGQ